ncbi:MAG: chitobiase/beta-hexosaminidase C-terminal domain-containing protein [Lachnospiraceae bacterium]|nr:chitobiase/beta-hexosaminidase C-terminal domain-containing protein [Lachnospiraceae bacterium]
MRSIRRMQRFVSGLLLLVLLMNLVALPQVYAADGDEAYAAAESSDEAYEGESPAGEAGEACEEGGQNGEGGDACAEDQSGEGGDAVPGEGSEEPAEGEEAVDEGGAEILSAESDGSFAEATGEEVLGLTESQNSITVSVNCIRTQARKAAARVNEIRTEQKVRTLSYDYGLEEKAMQRATEAAVRYSTVRPDASEFSTIYTAYIRNAKTKELLLNELTKGEEAVNRWFSASANDILTTDYAFYGIGCVIMEGHYFWALEYTNRAISSAVTSETDKVQNYEMIIVDDYVKGASFASNPAGGSKLKLEYQKGVPLPRISAWIRVDGHKPDGAQVRLAKTATTWKVEDSSLAVIEGETIKALKARGDGTLKAEAKACDYTENYSYPLHVVVHPVSVSLNVKSLQLDLDESAKLEWTVLPADADDRSVKLSSDNPLVATVNEKGEVTGAGSGSTVIRIKTVDNGLTDQCTVSVRMVLQVGKPQASPAGGDVPAGTQVRLSSPTPDAGIRYTLDGREPDAGVATEYSGPISISEDCVLKAVAYKNGIRSATLIEEYHVIREGWGDICEEDRSQWASPEDVPDGLWVAAASIPELVYNGKKQTPKDFRVYDHTKLLSKKDYNLSYRDNKDAGNAFAFFEFKGDYSGKLYRNFTILPASVSEASCEPVSVKYKGSVIEAKLNVKWNGKKLVPGKDYDISCDEVLREPGSYKLIISGKGNFRDSLETQLTIVGELLDLSAAKVRRIPTQDYLEEGYHELSQLKDSKGQSLALSVKVKGQELKEGTDYEAVIRKGDRVGEAELILKGIGDRCCGVRRVKFKIRGTVLSKAAVLQPLSDAYYTGAEIRPEACLTLKSSGKALEEGRHYTVSYKNNVKAGTGKLTVTGIGEAGYRGTISKIFRIRKIDISTAKVVYPASVKYVKGGVKPGVSVTILQGGVTRTLEQGVDYTVKYQANDKAAKATESAPPTLQIIGKGGYAGKTLRMPFTIEKRDISTVNAHAADKEADPGKAGIYKSTPVLTDDNGKRLAAGKDYDANKIFWRYDEDCYVTCRGSKVQRLAGEGISQDDIIPPGTALHIAVAGIGNYNGVVRVRYKVGKPDISKAKGTVDDQIYTGREIILSETQIRLSRSGIMIGPENYEITGYKNNKEAGTATVTIRGKGVYCGEKSIKFRIKKKNASWLAGRGD